jgi:hypothetical protein
MATFEVRTRLVFENIHLVEADSQREAEAIVQNIEEETVYVQKHLSEELIGTTEIEEIWWTDWQLKQYKEGWV